MQGLGFAGFRVSGVDSWGFEVSRPCRKGGEGPSFWVAGLSSFTGLGFSV